MDGERFDALTKVLGSGITRRGAATVFAALAASGLAESAAAKPKKKKGGKGGGKKKKKTSPPCRELLQTCSGNCCGGLGCGDNGCDEGNVCFLNENGKCFDDCDCRADLNCSERLGDTCQDCGYPQDSCDPDHGNEDCCLSASICGDNFCDDGNVCCQPLRAFCDDDDCDCCGASTICGDNDCDAPPVCCQDVGFECPGGNNCECCFPLNCSQQVPGTLTCQNCALPQDFCEEEADCCLIASTCQVVDGCGDDPICCQETGARCFDDCDCCGDDVCEGNPGTCVGPARESPGVERSRERGKVASEGSSRARWSQL